MGNGILGRGGRAREDEQAALAAGCVDRAARGIPGGRDFLPLIDDVGTRALQRQRRISLSQRLNVRVVQMHDAFAER